MLYRVTVRQALRAYHYLIGGDWGAENKRHYHDYTIELEFRGERLNEHGYLIDIAAVQTELRLIHNDYSDQTLNELAEFAGLNPSVEHFARILHQRLAASLDLNGMQALRVRLWEEAVAAASYEELL